MGNYSKVYASENDETVAVKFFEEKRKNLFSSGEHFILELTALLSLKKHPNIVSLEAVVNISTCFAILFERMETSLKSLILYENKERLTKPFIFKIASDVLKAQAYLHSASIVHRDVKPDNILISIGDGPVKLADFGLAVSIYNYLFLFVSKKIGTLKYMSPEAFKKGDAFEEKYRTARDLWALGVTVISMKLFSMWPYREAGVHYEDLLERIFADGQSPLKGRFLEGEYGIFDACLSPDPAGRPTAAELLKQVDDLRALF